MGRRHLTEPARFRQISRRGEKGKAAKWACRGCRSAGREAPTHAARRIGPPVGQWRSSIRYLFSCRISGIKLVIEIMLRPREDACQILRLDKRAMGMPIPPAR